MLIAILRITYFIALLPIFVGVYRRAYQHLETRFVFVFVCFSFSWEMLSLLHVYTSAGENNLFLLHFYTVIEFLLVAQFFKQLLIGNIKKRIVLACQVLIPLFAFIDLMYFEPITAYNSYTRSVAAILLILGCIGLFAQLLERRELQLKGIITLNSAFFIYLSSGLILFMLADQIVLMSLSMSYALWTAYSLIIIFFYSLLAIGLWIHKPN